MKTTEYTIRLLFATLCVIGIVAIIGLLGYALVIGALELVGSLAAIITGISIAVCTAIGLVDLVHDIMNGMI